MIKPEAIGVKIPKILLPGDGADYSKWAVVACDQYTSQKEYWVKAEEIVGGAPSTLKLILPEAYLGAPDEADRIESAKAKMRGYLDDGTLKELPEGFVLVKREVDLKQRLGLVIALDLEQYDYHKGASTLIRATEGTIEDRIPPRLRIRGGAKIELPHILVLIDDPGRTVIEPLADQSLKKLYSTELMLGGGHVEGYLVDDPALIESVIEALHKLTDEASFRKKYGAEHSPLLFAMGDGNHSFATAKAAWENIKASLSEEEKQTHPARYALVEIENVHDEGIIFEPIHRALFGIEPEAALSELHKRLEEANAQVELIRMQSENELDAYMQRENGAAHVLAFYHKEGCGVFLVGKPSAVLCVGTLQNALDALNKGEIDYIHGKEATIGLSKRDDALCFLLPAMKKSELFKTVVYDGALPRKTFSMGEANEKRYYMECRRIMP